jgi:predicted transcriptional regulator
MALFNKKKSFVWREGIATALARHLAVHGLTPMAYKRKHSLCSTQSLCIYDLARRREALAQNLLANGGEVESI